MNNNLNNNNTNNNNNYHNWRYNKYRHNHYGRYSPHCWQCNNMGQRKLYMPANKINNLKRNNMSNRHKNNQNVNNNTNCKKSENDDKRQKLSNFLKKNNENHNNENEKRDKDETEPIVYEFIIPLNEVSKKPSDNPLQDIFSKIKMFNELMEKKHKNENDDKNDKNEMDTDISEEFFNKEYDEIINMNVETLDDLIRLGEMYDPQSIKKYNINLKRMNDLIVPLKELRNMIGMEKVKQNIVDLIVYYLQDFEKNSENMLHTVIEGKPGVGKTACASILAKIYLKMGIVKKDIFRVVRRSDLIGQYLGSTALKTQQVIDEVQGGVLFIDEAYSLGNQEKRDSFSKECIDTLNQNLTENKGKFICIIAGYKEELRENFFNYNPGLERRFPFRFTIEEYKPSDLRLIFLKMVKDNKWDIESNQEISLEFFERNKKYFNYSGGDMETLLHLSKICHARRVFCLPRDKKKKLNMVDLERGMNMFLNNEVRKDVNTIPDSIKHIYM